MQLTVFIIVSAFFLQVAVAQDSIPTVNVLTDHRYDKILQARRQKALNMLDKEDELAVSSHWPNIKPSLFFANIKKNILFPDYINQGKSTNFCGYAALTHLLLRYYPDAYTEAILSLYHNGNARLKKKLLQPTPEVLLAAGTLKNKGQLDVHHANQLWFLTLADQFKGYLNFIDHHYNPGDENRIWAGTNYRKFNKMLMHFTDDTLTRRGSDFLRPFTGNFYNYISEQLSKGIVLLYVNSKWLYPHKYSLFKLRAPTHFIVLYNMYQSGDMIEIQYWDYGLRTEQQITGKRLRQLVFGVTTINHTSNDKN